MASRADDEGYWVFSDVLGIIAAIVAFLGSWIYCVSEYGYLLGFGLGWLPSGILAAIIRPLVKFLWPLIALAVLYMVRH